MTIKGTEWDLRLSHRATLMMENTLMEKSTDKVNMYGIPESTLKANGREDRNMDMVFGKVLPETLILVNGRTISLTGMESMYGVTKMFMKVFGKHV
jgi:hypothetical protein